LAAHVKTQDDLTEQLKHNQKLLTTSNLDLQEAKIESGQHFNEFEGIRCELVVSREERTRLGAQCDQLLADKERMASEISSLMERMNDAIKLGEDCSLDLQQCREALKTSNEEIVEFKQKIEAKEEMCDKFRSEVIQLKDKHHHLQGNVESLSLDKERMTRALEDESEKIDLINADNKSQVKFMEDKLAIMDKESKDLKQTIADLQEHLETKEGEFVQSLDELERDLAEKTKDCESTQVKIQNLTETCEKNTTELGNSQGKLDEAKKSNLVLEGQVEQLHTTVATLEKDVKTLKDDKNSKMSSIKLLLSNQRKLESQLKKTSNDHEDLAKEKEAMVQQVADRDALEVEVTKHHTRIAELEAEINVPIGQMSWEMDPELQDMTPMELRSILGKELTPHEKAKLNEMCVAELVKDMKVKTSNETSLIWEISTLKKELQKNKIKLNHLEDQRSVARALLDTDKVSTPPIESSTTATTRKSKRRSVTMSKTQQEPNTSTRLSRSKMNVESESSSDVVVSATKKARKETSAVKVVEEKTRENPPSVVVGGRLKRGRSMMRLDNAMPDNPFTTKKSTASSLTVSDTLKKSFVNSADISHTTILFISDQKAVGDNYQQSCQHGHKR
jgi:chromosome segregation ATPase